MLDSVKIQRRQSEIRQELATLVGKDAPSEDETRSMESLDSEYRSNETRYRAALIAEDSERREAGEELETRSDREYADLVSKFEVRQVVDSLTHGTALSGETAEIVAEMRSQGSFRGMPVPLEALETRNNTVSTGLYEPKQTTGIFDRLFPQSVAARLGVNAVQIAQGQQEYPVATAGATSGWAVSEGGNVPNATPFTTAEAILSPDYLLGTEMRISRKSLKMVGVGLEAAIRTDMAASIGAELDRAILLGSGLTGEPTGIVTGATNTTAITGAATWSTFKTEVLAFLAANAIGDPSQVNLGLNPQEWADLDDAIWDAGSGITEWDRLVKHMGAPVQATQLTAGTALMTVTAGGLSPAYIGLYGGVDLIRDPYSDAQSGGLRLTGLLTTSDVVIPRQAQVRVITGIGSV